MRIPGRIRTIVDDGHIRRAFIQFASAEIVVMVVALSSTASPDMIVLHGNQ